MSNYKGISVLLTGAIDIESTPFAINVSKEFRVNEYISSINYMIKRHPSLNFIYVDSSDYNLAEKHTEFIKFRNFESVSFDGQNIVKKKGKGAGELESIKFALENSELLKEANYILKLNGRYKLSNLKNIIKDLNLDTDNSLILGEFRHYNKWFDSRCFLASKSFYKDLAKFETDDFSGIFFENILAQNVNLYLGSLKANWKMFNRKPKYVGTSGDKGQRFRSNKIKSILMDNFYRLKNFLISL